MAPPRKQAHSQAELAKMAGVNVKTIRQWKNTEGLDLGDVAAVLARAGKVERDTPADGSETYSEARRRRAIADADRAEIIAKRESGSVIAVADVQNLFTQLGAELRSRLLAMRGNLVVELEGQSGPAIYKILDNRIHEILTSIHENAPVAD